MNKAYKFRIYPTKEQEILLAKTFGCTRFIYNKMLSDKIDHYQATKEKLVTTPAQYKKDFPWLKEVDSLALCNAQLHLQTAYNNFFKMPKVGFPKFKSKHKNHLSYTTNNQKGSIRIESGKLKLPKVGYVKIIQHRGIPHNYQLKSVTISQTPSGKYYASLLFEYEQIIVPKKVESILGLDFSMHQLFVASDGQSANYPRYYRQALTKLQKESRKLAKCQKGSQNRAKQRLKVARLHEKIAHQRKDFLHKISRQITNAYDAVGVESLNMKAMAKSLNFGKSVADNGWGMFVNMLSYKLAEAGKQLMKVDQWYASSKTCSECGRIKEALALKDRIYRCECGLELDRDLNASINIREESKRMLV